MFYEEKEQRLKDTKADQDIAKRSVYLPSYEDAGYGDQNKRQIEEKISLAAPKAIRIH
jgi:hypothetical protein